MRKKGIAIICFVLVGTLLFSAHVFAALDFSVFENKDVYTVDLDPMDDTGSISRGDDFITALELDNDAGVMASNADIFCAGSFELCRFLFMYFGDTPFRDMNTVIIKTEEARYTFSGLKTVEDSGAPGIVLTLHRKEAIGLLRDLATDEEAPMIRFTDGTIQINGSIILTEQNREAFGELYEDYVEAGGLDQDKVFEILCTVEPIEIKYLKETKEETKEVKHDATIGEKNALQSAESYLRFMNFSYSGLINQLKYEGYSDSEAAYAADHCGADWFEQAAGSAAAYLKYMSFSRNGLISQLEYEGFTYEQAVYGVEQNGY